MCLPLFVVPMIAEAFDERAPWIGDGARVAFYLSIAVIAAYSALIMRTQKDLERLVLLESAAVALCAVLASALVYAALHEFDVVRPPTRWLFWNVGVISWAVARLVITRLRT